MKQTIITIVAMVCLTLLGIFTKVDSIAYTVAVLIGGAAGFYIPKAYTYLKNMRKYDD